MIGWMRSFAALLHDTWLEFIDAKSLWLVLLTIAVLFGVALTIHGEPLAAGRTYLDLAARSLSADTNDLDPAEVSLHTITTRLDGSISWIQSAEPISLVMQPADGQPQDGPKTSWRVTLVRNTLPVVGKMADTNSIATRFGRVADGELWRVHAIRETTAPLAARLGSQRWEMVVNPGRDLMILWPHRMTLFGDALELTPPQGAPLGLEVFILQKLLATGLGGTALLLVSVVITASFVPTMIRKGTLELLLARPVHRWQLILGKFIAAILFVAGMLGLLVGATWVVTGIVSGLWAPGILLAVVSLLLFYGLLLSVSIFAGTLTRSAPAAMLIAVAYWAVLFVVGILHAQVVASHVREDLTGRPRPLTVADALRGRSEPRAPLEPQKRPFHRTAAGRIVEATYRVLPHSSDLDAMVDRQLMRGFSVGGRMRQVLESGEFSWLGGVGLTVAHATAFLVAACVIFGSRDP